MFYDRFLELCAKKGVRPTNACIEAGLSRGLAAKWKSTGTEKPSADALEKMSAYFGMSIDKILGNELQSAAENKKSPAPEGAELTPNQIRAIEKIKNMPPEELARKMAALEAVLDM